MKITLDNCKTPSKRSTHSIYIDLSVKMPFNPSKSLVSLTFLKKKKDREHMKKREAEDGFDLWDSFTEYT